MKEKHEEKCTGIFNEGPACESCLEWVRKMAKEKEEQKARMVLGIVGPII